MPKLCSKPTASSLLVLFGIAAAAAQPPGGMPVVVSTIQQRDVPATVRLVGTVYAMKSSVLASETAGIVERWHAEEGQFVKVGEPVLALDETLPRLYVDAARAELGALRARLEELERGSRPEDIARMEAAVTAAESMMKKAEFERNRVLSLFEAKRANPKEQHDAEMEFASANAEWAEQRAMLERERNGPRREVIESARFDVAAQEATLARLERALKKSRVLAPYSGFVVRKRTEVGEWIEEGGAVCDFVDIETVKVRAEAPESTVQFARPGASCTVEIDACGLTRSAPIARLIPQANTVARTVPLEIDLPNQDHAVLPGMFAWVVVPAGPPGPKLLVSKDAVVVSGREKSVYVVRPGPQGGDMAMPTPVQTGLEIGELIEIQGGGLVAGDRVVVRANERLFGPTPVTPLPADSSVGAAGSASSAPASQPVE